MWKDVRATNASPVIGISRIARLASAIVAVPPTISVTRFVLLNALMRFYNSTREVLHFGWCFSRQMRHASVNLTFKDPRATFARMAHLICNPITRTDARNVSASERLLGARARYSSPRWYVPKGVAFLSRFTGCSPFFIFSFF